MNLPVNDIKFSDPTDTAGEIRAYGIANGDHLPGWLL